MLKKVLRAYKYIYFRKYTLYIKKIGNKSLPHTSVLYDMITVFTLYLALFFLIVLKYLEIVVDFRKIRFQMIIVIIIIYLGHYFLFNYNNKYLLLEKEFLNESKNTRYINGWLVTIYSLGSVVFCFIYALIN